MSSDHRVYRSFEEFEREELMRLDGVAVEDLGDGLFGEDLEILIKHAARRSDPRDFDDE